MSTLEMKKKKSDKNYIARAISLKFRGTAIFLGIVTFNTGMVSEWGTEEPEDALWSTEGRNDRHLDIQRGFYPPTQ